MKRSLLTASLVTFLAFSVASALFDGEPRQRFGSGDRVPVHDIATEPVDNVPDHPVSVRASLRKARSAVLSRSDASGAVGGFPCGGDLPPCSVLACESGGNPTAQNPTSSASGLWQVLRSTWAGFGGYPEAWLAPPHVQNEHARLLWRGGAGASHWRSCL